MDKEEEEEEEEEEEGRGRKGWEWREGRIGDRDGWGDSGDNAVVDPGRCVVVRKAKFAKNDYKGEVRERGIAKK